MKQNWQKAVLKHVYAILIFLGLSFLFCSPVLEGLEIRQTDTVSWQAMSQEARAYHDSTGIKPLWTNAMFGGMPTYQIYLSQDNYTYQLHRILTLGLPKPVNFFFLAMLGFYILLSVMGFRQWVNILGAIAFGFASYNPMIISAGHDTKMFTIAYMAPLLAGILLTYRGKYLIGGIMTCITLCLMVTNGHYQIVFYMLLLCLVIGIGYLVNAIRTQQVPQYIKATLVLLGFGLLSVLPSTVSLWTTSEFSKYTMRGGHSELTAEAGQEADKTAGGLDKSYAFNWSEGRMETLTALVPNLYGGSSNGALSASSNTAKVFTEIGVPPAQQEQILAQMPVYWGPQPHTDGPVYWGAAIIFLFVLAFFIVKDFSKWWILAGCLLGVFLAWGSNFAFFNYFLFDHLPLFSKFRAPAQALVLCQLLVPFLACWALNDVVSKEWDKKILLESIKRSLYITGGLVILLLLASFGLSYSAEQDEGIRFYQQLTGGNQEIIDKLMSALRADRASALRLDAIRSLVFILIAAGLLWAYLQKKLQAGYVLALLTLSVAVDQMLVAHRILNSDNYVTPADYSGAFAPSPVDVAIKQDKDPYYRVFNTVSFMDAMSSYHHRSIGGYSPVKLALYDDLIKYQISKNNPHVLNMLNAKYVIVQQQGQQGQGQLAYFQNPEALGNAWFVDSLVWAKNADEEMKTLDSLPTGRAAVIDQRFKPVLNGFVPGKDSASKIQLTRYGLNELQYRSTNSKPGFAVFSEVYYPAGWNLYVDGKKEEIVRTDYLLRGAKIPAGDHQVVMKFEPRSYYLGNAITRWSSIAMLVLLALAIAFEVRRSVKAQPAVK